MCPTRGGLCPQELRGALSRAQGEQRAAERVAQRLHKEKEALRGTLDKVQREQLRCREDSLRLRRSLGCAERDLAQAQNRVRLLQAQVSVLEHPSPMSPRLSPRPGERGHHSLEEQLALLKGQELRPPPGV
ncbi:hypothetical protein AV530_011409 [Patagioenas fasciata monilis]|uniref:Uncharacterized protein n=1 Tax=Patagioenas fasciata monilis TaxID=372326 RepID=A0A1V4KPA4_PATFA|nr:hypothetical protein AV530_011409 [Patagioenas fasciata monilis]